VAYNTKKLEKQSLEAITANNLVFIEEVVSYLPCDKKTFYAHELHESNAIKDALEKNKVDRKGGLREKMYNAENPTAWIALYKLIGTDEEAEKLNGSKQKIENTGKDGGPMQTEVVYKVEVK
jgi:uncharacterized membrane-anchored protein